MIPGSFVTRWNLDAIEAAYQQWQRDPQSGDGPRVVRDAAGMGFAYQYNWGSPHRAGALFAFADGSVRLVPHGTAPGVVLAVLTPKGGEVVAEPF